VAISSDAHGVDGFEMLRYGVGQARRGWLEKADVLNARPLAALRRGFLIGGASPAGRGAASARGW